MRLRLAGASRLIGGAARLGRPTAGCRTYSGLERRYRKADTGYPNGSMFRATTTDFGRAPRRAAKADQLAQPSPSELVPLAAGNIVSLLPVVSRDHTTQRLEHPVGIIDLDMDLGSLHVWPENPV